MPKIKNLKTFSKKVTASARKCQSRFWTDDMLLIQPLWVQFEQDWDEQLSLDAFKKHLLDAYRAGFVALLDIPLFGAFGLNDDENASEIRCPEEGSLYLFHL